MDLSKPVVSNTTAPANLDARSIRADLGDDSWTVQVEAELDSTNSTLLDQARKGMLDAALRNGPVFLAAERQRAGRGRNGRSWHAAPGVSLACSIAWKSQHSVARLSGLSLACGLAVRDTVQAMGVLCALKWPNDLLSGGRKLAGLLLEICPTADNGTIIVIGVGINVAPDAGRDRSLDTASLPATDLCSALAVQTVDRNRLAAQLARNLKTRLARFEQEGFAGFTEEWNAAHAWNGLLVRVDPGAGHSEVPLQPAMEGIARGVDTLGRLQIETAQGLRVIVGGDVSLRRL